MTAGAQKFIHVRSTKFPVLPGEDAELANPGMHGKALALYLESALEQMGHDVAFHTSEDWGWWIEIKGAPFPLGVQIYSGRGPLGVPDYAVTHSVTGARKWNWRKFAFVDSAIWANRLDEDLLSIFRSDPDVEVIGVLDEYPLDPEVAEGESSA